MDFRRLSILGVGLLGGSLGQVVRRVANNCSVVGYGRSRAGLEQALQRGAIDEAATSAAEAVKGADLVVLCAPVGAFESLLREVAPALAPGAIVTDVGSTKRSVVRLAEELLPETVRFVGSHPMAGSEKHGIAAADADLFAGALCITTPTGRTDPDALARVERLWAAIGMRVTRLTAEAHDRLVAEISHLPHAVAAALAMAASEQALPLAGRGFLDATRIAAGDAALWRDILLDNSDAIRAAAGRFRGQLDELLSILDRRDEAALMRWLSEASQRRTGLNPRQE